MRTFDCPVFVKSGSYIVEEVGCLEDALEFLYEWPEHRRGKFYQTALNACQGVIERDISLRAARAAFASFAKSVGILEEVDMPLPWQHLGPKHSGGASA